MTLGWANGKEVGDRQYEREDDHKEGQLGKEETREKEGKEVLDGHIAAC